MLALAAFAPPQAKREPAQQEPPKSWIPERRSEAEPPIDAPVDPPKPPSIHRHPVEVVCSSTTNGSETASRQFVESYQAASAALRAQRYEDAIALVDAAAEYARGDREWLAIEGLRIVAFSRLQNDQELIASVEAALSTGCLSLVQRANYEELLRGARLRLATPPPP